MEIKEIAKILHNVDRSFRLALGEKVEYADIWDNDSEVNKQRFIDLAQAIVDNKTIKVDQLHELCIKPKLEQGYVFGTTEDSNIKTSPLIVRFKDLAVEHKTRYSILREIVLSIS